MTDPNGWRDRANRDALRDAMEDDDWRPPEEVVRQLLDCIDALDGVAPRIGEDDLLKALLEKLPEAHVMYASGGRWEVCPTMWGQPIGAGTTKREALEYALARVSDPEVLDAIRRWS